MTGGRDITIREDKAVALYELETRFAMAVRQRELLEQYIKERLTPDKHFYTVGDEPGRKPSLTKEGAELICLPHNLKPRYAILSGPENPPMDDSPYQITVNCELMNGEQFGGQGVGSASSMVTKKDGTRVQRQKDPGLRHNATIKMACKSAYIAATLNSTAASEFFTQDLEDDQTGQVATAQPTGEHFCHEHNTPFFKKGKMKSYAHPISNTGEWCYERSPFAKTAASKTKTKTKQEPETSSEEQAAPQQIPTDEKTTPAQPSKAAEKESPRNTDIRIIRSAASKLDWNNERLLKELRERTKYISFEAMPDPELHNFASKLVDLAEVA